MSQIPLLLFESQKSDNKISANICLLPQKDLFLAQEHKQSPTVTQPCVMTFLVVCVGSYSLNRDELHAISTESNQPLWKNL